MPSESLTAPAHAGASPGASPPPRSTLATLALADACRALWLATLSLMTAFMHTRAPAHRTLLARRIVKNLRTLAAQPACFDLATRDRFGRLAGRWQAHVAH